MRGIRAVAVGAGLLFAAFGACHLGLDESLIPPKDAGPDGTGGGGGGIADSAFGGSGGGPKPDSSACDADPQCLLEGSCYVGHCATGKCLYDFCPSSDPCKTRSCDLDANACSAPKPVGFGALTLDLGLQIGCNGVARNCIAAFDDIVIAGTKDGRLNAWRSVSATNLEPLNAPLPSFTVTRLVASQHRVLAVGTLAAGHLELGWIDPPADSSSTDLPFTSVTVSISGASDRALPATPDDFYLAGSDPVDGFAAALVSPPVKNGTSLSLFDGGAAPTGTQLVASSGTQLVAMNVDDSVNPITTGFRLVTDAGTSSASLAATEDVGFESPSAPAAHAFASGYEGTVWWSTNRVFRDTSDTPLTNTVVLRRLLATGAQSFGAPAEIDVASYPDADYNVTRSGPLAEIDADNVVLAVASPSDTSKTLIRVATNSAASLALVDGSGEISAPVDQVGVAANRTFGFVLLPGLNGASLVVIAPICQ
jgi:hypothetical protein